MMKTFKTATAILTLSSAILLSPLAFSHPGSHAPGLENGPRGDRAHMMRMMVNKLSLTEEQIELLQTSSKPTLENVKQLRDLRGQLRELTFSDGYSESLAKDISQQITTLMQENDVNRANARHEFYASLSDEQKTTLAEMEANRPERPRRLSLQN